MNDRIVTCKVCGAASFGRLQCGHRQPEAKRGQVQTFVICVVLALLPVMFFLWAWWQQRENPSGCLPEAGPDYGTWIPARVPSDLAVKVWR